MSRTRPFSCRRCGLPCTDLQGLRAHECRREGRPITDATQAATAIGEVLAGLTSLPAGASARNNDDRASVPHTHAEADTQGNPRPAGQTLAP